MVCSRSRWDGRVSISISSGYTLPNMAQRRCQKVLLCICRLWGIPGVGDQEAGLRESRYPSDLKDGQ
jgi:hypothetical protein